MHFLPILAGISVALALPTQLNESLNSFPNTTAVQAYSDEDVHSNILKNFPSEYIISSENLIQFIREHPDNAHSVYLRDTKVFIDTSSLSGHAIQKRQGGFSPPVPITQTSLKNARSWWSAWQPASSCQHTGLDGSGGSINIGWSYSVAAQVSAGISLKDVIKDLTATVGFSLTTTSTKSGTETCNIPGNSVGQVWSQVRLGYADVQSQTCWYYNGALTSCNAVVALGSITVPGDSSQPRNYQIGCSVGSSNVRC